MFLVERFFGTLFSYIPSSSTRSVESAGFPVPTIAEPLANILTSTVDSVVSLLGLSVGSLGKGGSSASSGS